MTAAIVVFSDLDGTLLDHASYRFDAAETALEELRRRGIELILCSSKTAAEIIPIRARLGFEHCSAIVENGAGLLGPGASGLSPAPRHADLLERLNRLPADLRACFSGFSDWTLETLSRLTGLDSDSAALARQRDFTEPGLIEGDAGLRREFIAALEQQGITALQGGRFLTLGFGADKSQWMRQIKSRIERQSGAEALSVALGDAPNDVEMLNRADIGIIIPNPAHAGIPTLSAEREGRIRRAALAGPAGWNQSVLDILAQPEQTKETSDG